MYTYILQTSIYVLNVKNAHLGVFAAPLFEWENMVSILGQLVLLFLSLFHFNYSVSASLGFY